MQTTRIAPRIPLIALALLLGACDAAGPTAPPVDESVAEVGAPTFNRNGVSQRLELDTHFWNACTGENLHLTGTITRVAQYREDEGGGYHWLANYTVQGRAVGLTTGTEYILHETHNMKENGGAGFYFTMSFIATAVTPGSGSNQLWQWDWRYRVDESGAIVTDEYLFECIERG